MKRNRIIMATIIALALTTIAYAAVPGIGRRAFGRHDGERRTAMRERVATILDLTEAQMAQWNAIQTATHEAMAPLAAQRQANRAAFRAAMSAENPDPTKLGELMLANRALGERMRTLREQSRARFEGILTPEQKAKHEELKSLRDRRGPRGRMGRGAGMGPMH
jgi:Spy/CpxP family protein refolding chaperone